MEANGSFYYLPATRQVGRVYGIGAFNLVGAEVYERIGTHWAIAVRPDDDMKLGNLIKRSRFRQELFLDALRASLV